MEIRYEGDGSVELRERMLPGKRVLFILLALFPLLAPYELLIRPGWTSYLNFIFILSLVISLGALFLSGFLIFAAVAGLSTQLRFSASERTLTYLREAPIVPLRRELIAFDSISRVEVEKHDWSDGDPTYSLRVTLEDGRTFKSGSVWNQTEINHASQRIEGLLAV